MGFFKKLAKGLGIGVANVTLEIPAIISKNVWELDGVVTISAESDLLVEKISIEIEETVAETRTQFSGENVYEECCRFGEQARSGIYLVCGYK